MVSYDTPIFLVHGFRGVAWMHIPLELTLRYRGFTNIHRISYPSTRYSVPECRYYVAKTIMEYLNSPLDDFIVIGHSMGGLISRDLYKEGLIPRICVMIATPQDNVRFAIIALRILPDRIANAILGQSGIDLTIPSEEVIPPPCEYYTVSTSLPYTDNFDGMIMTKNMCIDNNRNYHIGNTQHSVVLFDPRLIKHVVSLIHPDNRPYDDF